MDAILSFRAERRGLVLFGIGPGLVLFGIGPGLVLFGIGPGFAGPGSDAAFSRRGGPGIPTRAFPAARAGLFEVPGAKEVEAEVDVFRRAPERDGLRVLVHGRLPLVAGEEGEAVPKERFFDGYAPADAVGVDLREPRVDLAVDVIECVIAIDAAIGTLKTFL